MVEQFRTEKITETNFRLLSVAALLNKIHDGITFEELYRDAERKFDILIELLNNTDTDNSILNKFEYSLDDLKQVSYLIFDRLISETNSNPYVTLCVSEDASLEEIRRRRNKLLHIFHPDRNQKESAVGTYTRKINEAYEKIVNRSNRVDIPFENTKIDLSHYYQHKKKMKFTLFLISMISLLAFLLLMNRYYFF